MSIILVLLEMIENEDEVIERRRTLRSLRDNSNPFEMPDRYFEASFRLCKEACSYIMEELAPHDRQKTSIPFAVRFFTTLYFFANGSYQKCFGNNYVVPMSQPSVSRTIRYISALIAKHKASEISFPTANVQQLAIKSGFFSKFGMKGKIGAIDCTHVTIVCPPKNDVTRPCSIFMNRKGNYSMNVEVVGDDNLKILAINATYPGSVHDSAIWTTSSVRNYMRTLRGTWLLGDQGYPLEPWLMTPLSVANTTKEERYNKIHCKARNVIERCFGVLKSRFQCLLRERVLYYRPEVVVVIVSACAILHNIMVAKFPNSRIEVIEEPGQTDHVDSIPDSASNLHSEGERVRQQIINTI